VVSTHQVAGSTPAGGASWEFLLQRHGVAHRHCCPPNREGVAQAFARLIMRVAYNDDLNRFLSRELRSGIF
jgi:hypothetical protein